MRALPLQRVAHCCLLATLAAAAALAESWHGPRPPKPHLDPEAQAAQVLGPFALQPCLSLYLISDGAPARGRAIVQQGRRNAARTNRVMLRMFDADERLTHWQYGQSNVDDVIVHPQDPYVHGLAPLPLDPDDSGGKVLIDGHFALVGKGVHQIRSACDQFFAPVTVALSRKMEWGVSFQNGDWTQWPGCPDTFWAYVPPRASELNLTFGNGRIRVSGPGGRLLWDASAVGKKRVTKKISVGRTGVVWRVEFPKGSFFLKAHGFPFILCSSEAAAAALKASVEVLPDGTVVCHKFQRRIAELLPKVLAPENVGEAEGLIVPLITREEEWLADPLRNAILCGYSPFIRGVAYALRQQCVDPGSRWSGLFSDYEPPAGVSAKDYRWDTYLPVTGIGGCRKVQTGASGLAKAATLDVPLNPYHGTRALLYRAAASSLRDLMVLQEAEVWPRAAAHWYASSMSFVMGNKNLPPFGLAAGHMPDDIREVWTEGARRMLDRSYTNQLVTARNQSSHCLVANECFAIGSQDPVYVRLSRLYAAHFAATANPAGWHKEACGPCGSYIGMTHWHFAKYYRLSHDDAFLPCIAKSYRFFNHTVAPEPDGRTMLGGFNFNHRVGMGFFMEQYSGAKGTLDDVLPEVGIWSGPMPTEDELAERREEAIERIKKELRRPRDVFPGHLTDPDFEYYAPPENHKRGTWPALEPGPFIRNIDNQLICVKRSGYYVTVYVGKPAGTYYIRGKEKFRLPLPNNAESNGGHGQPKPITPYLGGGLSMLWTPQYGAALMAANWSPLCHHGLVATREDGKRYWEDYHAAEFELDPDAGLLTVTGRIESLPLRYERRYTFADEEVAVAVTLTADEDVELKGLIENLPFAFGRLKVRGAKIAQPAMADQETDRIWLVNNDRAGVEFILDRPRQVHLCRNGMISHYKRYQINRAEILLPTDLRAGAQAGFSYVVKPTAP